MLLELDPDSKAPTNVVQRIADNFHSLYRWSKTNEAIVSGSVLTSLQYLSKSYHTVCIQICYSDYRVVVTVCV